MSPGDLYSSRRFSIYDSFIYNLYRERYYYFIDRDLQVINFFSVSPMNTRKISKLDSVSKDEIINQLKDFMGIEEDYNLLILPNQFSAYYLLLFASTDVGDEILTPSPIPYFLPSYANSLSLNSVILETSGSENYDIPHRRDFEDRLTSRTKLFYYSEPGFSGGVVYSEESLERILFICRNYNMYLSVDETLEHLLEDRENYTFMRDIAFENERLIRIKSILKDFSLGEATIMTFHTALPEKLKTIAEELFPPSPAQLSTLKYFLSNIESIRKERIAEMQQKREIIRNFINKREDISTSYYNGFSSYFLKLPVPNAETFVEWLLCSYNRDKKTVFLAPATFFHSAEYEDTGEVLIDYRYINPEVLEEGLEILQDALDRYTGLKKEE